MNARLHDPVMLDEMVSALDPRDGGVYLDGTFGAGGYAQAIVQAADCAVLAIDRDADAIARGREMERNYPGRLTVLHGRFGEMSSLLKTQGVREVDGVVLDLGVSSPQLDRADRGFSFRFDAPLDMRMDRSGPTAADIVNRLDEAELANIIRRLGEDRLAKRIAGSIAAARAETPITRTAELAEIVRRVAPRAKDGLDPATRTFMALRMHVNDELGELDRGLEGAERLLAAGGRLVVISFHSLEDRKVKRFLRTRSAQGAGVSRHAPAPGRRRAPSFDLLQRRALKPRRTEIEKNPRARSARLRAAVRTKHPAWPPESERIAA